MSTDETAQDQEQSPIYIVVHDPDDPTRWIIQQTSYDTLKAIPHDGPVFSPSPDEPDWNAARDRAVTYAAKLNIAIMEKSQRGPDKQSRKRREPAKPEPAPKRIRRRPHGTTISRTAPGVTATLNIDITDPMAVFNNQDTLDWLGAVVNSFREAEKCGRTWPKPSDPHDEGRKET